MRTTKEKQIIIYYINVDGYAPVYVEQILAEFENKYKIYDQNIIQQFIPVVDQPTKIEYLTKKTEKEKEKENRYFRFMI